MTQGDNRTSERSPREDPVSVMWQKPEVSNWTSDSLQSASEAVWTKGYVVGHNAHNFYGVPARAKGRYGGMGVMSGIGV